LSKKSKKRGQKRPPPPRPAAAPRREAARARVDAPDDRPPAPWGSFPLVELVVLVALVLLVLGVLVVKGEQGAVMIGVGVALGSLAGLELSIREHFAGYRSHTLLLAGFVSAAVLAALFYLGPDSLDSAARLAIGVAVFGLCAWSLAAGFRRRAGVAFKVR
jgi:hypothetical protein